MTIKELKDILEKHDDSLPVVAYTSDKNYVVDIFIEPINIRHLGNFNVSNRLHPQMYYDVETSFSGDEAILVSIELPKKRF